MSVSNAYMALSGAVDAEVKVGERLARHTTYHIGGPAALSVTANTLGALQTTLSTLARERVEWVILGRGSNILASDAGYDGCVIRLGRDFSRISFDDDGHVSAGAATLLSKLVSQTLRHELSGLEFCVGIPGSVGGAVSMDAGLRHEWIGSCISSVVTLRPGEGLYRYDVSEIEWGYRWCSIPSSEIILEASLNLVPGHREDISREMERRLSMRRARQPIGKPSCGSVFKNPGDRSAARLIESCNLKGEKVGGARISPQHANFIVNEGGATAADVLALISRAHDAVERAYGVDLRPEVKLLGFGD